MGYIFRPGLHACDVAGSLVFLDLPADRYFLLAPDLNTICLQLCSGHELSCGDDSVHRLIDHDIVRWADSAIRPALCLPLPCPDTNGRDRGMEAPSALMITALVHYAFAIAHLKSRSLNRILDSIAFDKQRLSADGSAQDPAEVAAGFMAAARLITARGRCLARSIAIARTLVSRGIAPDLVLGVKLRPFEAHCWVQHGKTLISDDPGTVAPFSPILII